MSERYFIEQPISGDRATLAGPEAHHLIRVMRAAVGSRVVLFDGSGCEFPAVVERLGRDEVELRVLSREAIDRELPFELTIAVALPKGERQKWLIEKCVELGVARLVPLLTQRTVVRPDEHSLHRLRRAVIEASKQCGRNQLMQIDSPRRWTEYATDSPMACRLLAQPNNGDLTDYQAILAEHVRRNAGKNETINDVPITPITIIAAIGPEGGFSDEEVALAVASGWCVVDLGPRILRVETAAIALAAAIATHFPPTSPLT